MTILLTSYYYKPHFGGVENSIYNLALAFKEKGHRIIVFTSDADKSKKGRLPSEEMLDNIRIVRFKRFIPTLFIFSLFTFIVDYFRICRRLRKFSSEGSIDFIISRHYRLIPSIDAIFPFLQHYYIIPGVARFQQKTEDETTLAPSLKKRILQFYSNFITLPIKHLFQKLSLRRVHCIIFSERVRMQMKEAFPFYNKGLTKMEPGVDTRRFIPGVQKSKHAFTFLIAGRLIHHKRIDMAICALAKIHDKKARLVVVGDGPLKKELIALTTRENLMDRVEFKPYTPSPEKYYAESDAFLMTSTHESFGQTILEAFSCGLPVIGFNSRDGEVETATSEIVHEGLNGFLCPFSTEALAATMEKCMRMSPAEYSKISSVNQSLVANNYRWEVLAERILQHYSQAVA
jgi:glycosyltransferase involved in cell wall biosynthesis